MDVNPRRSRLARRSTALLAAVVVFAAAAATAAPVHQLPIVDRAIAFHGGDLYRASTTTLDVCSKSGCYHVVARQDGDLYEHVVSGQVGEHQRRVRATNDTVEVWQDGAPVAVADSEAQRYRDWVMQRIYFSFLPYRLNDPSALKEDLGVVDWRARSLHKVKVTFASGSSTDAQDEYLYWLDPETGQVELFAYSYEGRPGGLRFRRAINHRRVNGILFFDQENLGVEGDGLKVDAIDPAYVEQQMRPVSTVELREVTVEARPGG